MSLPPDVIAELQTIQIDQNGIFAGTALLIYDWVICFDLEKNHIWSRRMNVTSFLYLVVRYANILQYVWNSISGIGTTRVSCVVMSDILIILIITCMVAAAMFNALRVWAIWGQRWTVFAIVLLLGLMEPGAELYGETTIRFDSISSHPFPWGGCQWGTTMSPTVSQRLGSITRASGIIGDLAVLIATLWKTLGIKKMAREAGIKTGFSSLIIRDGSLYFVALSLINIACLVFDNIDIASPAQSFLTPISTVLLSRLLLNLRGFNNIQPTNSLNTVSMGSIHFANSAVIGNIGAPLDHQQYQFQEDDDFELPVEGPSSHPSYLISEKQALEDPLSIGVGFLGHEISSDDSEGLEIQQKNELERSGRQYSLTERNRHQEDGGIIEIPSGTESSTSV